MLHKVSTLLALLLAGCCVAGAVNADGPAAAQQRIRAAYVRLDAAYSQRNVPAIMALLAPGFVRREWNAALTPAQFQAALKDDFDGTVSVMATSRIKSLDIHGDSADVVAVRREDWTYPKPPLEQPPPYFRVTVTQEKWHKTQGKWRITEMADTALVQTLSLLNDRDQSLRFLPAAEWKKPATIAQVGQIDAADRARLKQIIRQYGWPGFDLVGTDGEETAWGIVQHSDEDRAFQKRCLPLLQAAVKRGQAMPSEVAYLTDRVLVGERKPQVYGTQWKIPIEDPVHINQRRASVGLGPLAPYEQQLKQMYQPAAKL